MANSVMPVALVISPDEPCYRLDERHMQSPGNRGFHRYQRLLVIRGDRLAEHVVDLGPASKWKGVEQFAMPGGVIDRTTKRIWIEHTVGEMQEMAETHRNGFMKGPQHEPTDLKKRLLESLDRQRARGSVFGQHMRVERN
ncbi:MAG: hypothetical protein NUW01_14195 [Gemmatimonadaceae bacterium]|nr:hypothetical protein [Gemmatimonadaceae bacterium]